MIAKEEIAEGHVSWSASKPTLVSRTLMMRLNRCVLVKMYIVGMGGSLPVLFWIVVLACWSLEEIALVVVGPFNRYTPHLNMLIRHSKLGF